MVILDEFLISDLSERKAQIDFYKAKYGDKYDDLVCCYEYGDPVKPKRIAEAFGALTKRGGLKKLYFMILDTLMPRSCLVSE